MLPLSSPRALLPRLGPLPRPFWPVLLALLLSAWLLLLPVSAEPLTLVPGEVRAGLTGLRYNLIWQVQTRGLTSLSHGRLLTYPEGADLLAGADFPLFALAAKPLVHLFGWPAGLNLGALLALWGVGCAMAWWSGRCFRSNAAALVGGVALQSSGVLLEALSEGHLGLVSGAACMPLALGLFTLALVSGRRDAALGAGVLSGVTALWAWSLGLQLVPALALLLLLAALERQRVLWPLFVLVLGIAAVAFVPALICAPTLTMVQGPRLDGGVGLLSTMQPLVLGLSLGLLAFRLPCRRWLLPLGLVSLGVLLTHAGQALTLAPGVVLPFPSWIGSMTRLDPRPPASVHGPLLGSMGLALLAGGGASQVWCLLHRILLRASRAGGRPDPLRSLAQGRCLPVAAGAILVGGLLAEAFLRLPALPLPSTRALPSDAARVLARQRGPVLLLPFSGGVMQPGYPAALDQVHHGRPLSGGLLYSLQTAKTMAPASVGAALVRLARCETRPEPVPEAEAATLRRHLQDAGLTSVLVDLHPPGFGPRGLPPTTLACWQDILGRRSREEPPFRAFWLDDAQGGARARPPASPTKTP